MRPLYFAIGSLSAPFLPNRLVTGVLLWSAQLVPLTAADELGTCFCGAGRRSGVASLATISPYLRHVAAVIGHCRWAGAAAARSRGRYGIVASANAGLERQRR